jgi:hypothetical protein
MSWNLISFWSGTAYSADWLRVKGRGYIPCRSVALHLATTARPAVVPTCFPPMNTLIDWLIMSMGARLRLWTAASNGPVVHPQRDIWAYRTMVRWWCRQGKTLDSSSRAPWQSYQQSHLGACRRNWRKDWQFYGVSISFHTCKWFFTCRKILRHGTSGFTFPPKEGVLPDFYRP